MEEECHLQEYYRSSNRVQLVRMSSFIDEESSFSTVASGKRAEDPNPFKKSVTHPLKRSSTIYVKSGENVEVKVKNISRPIHGIFKTESGTGRQSCGAKGDLDPYFPKEEAKISEPPKSVIIIRKPLEKTLNEEKASVDLGLGGMALIQKELKAKLTESLSPSPFKEVNEQKQENGLKQLVASVGTKKLLLAPAIYGSEVGAENSLHWKRALKDYILHTLQSISIIKKLKKIPPKLLASKNVFLNKSPGSTFFIILQ